MAEAAAIGKGAAGDAAAQKRRCGARGGAATRLQRQKTCLYRGFRRLGAPAGTGNQGALQK
jgi:hypothetical protein